MLSPTLITVASLAPFETVCERLPGIAQSHKFGVLGEHDLKQKMESKGLSFPPGCRVFEVCNPFQAHKILSGAIEVSTALPCRIAVYEQDGKTVLATIKPTALLGLFSSEGGAEIAQEVEAEMAAIMEETARVE